MKKIILLVTILFCFLAMPLYAQSFYTLKGNRVSYPMDIESGDVMIFIWTSRCPYCMRELREMNKDDDICKYSKCFFVNVGETEAEVKRVVKSLDLKSAIADNIIVDESAVLARKFSIIGVPTVLLLRNGEILDRSYHFSESKLKEVFKK